MLRRRSIRRTAGVLVALVAALMLASPASALAQAAGLPPGMSQADALKSFNEAMKQINEGVAMWHANPGVFPPDGPPPDALRDAIIKAYPEVGCRRIIAINEFKTESREFRVWAVNFEAEATYGGFHLVYNTVSFYDPGNPNFPNLNTPSAGGFLFVDPSFSAQLMLAQLTGAGHDLRDLKDMVNNQPLPPEAAPLAGIAGSMVVAFINGLALAGATKPPPMPSVAGSKMKDMKWYTWGGKWYLWSGLGKPIPASIYQAPDPSLFGDKIGIFTEPTPGYDGVTRSVLDNLGGEYGTTETNARLTPTGWRSMSDGLKEDTARALARDVARAYGIDPDTVNVRFVDDSPGSRGSWNRNTRVLEINPKSKAWDNPYGMARTIGHELRHAAQGDPNHPLGGASQDFRNLITKNGAGYIGASKDYTRYASQLYERDAEACGEAVGKAILNRAMGVQ